MEFLPLLTHFAFGENKGREYKLVVSCCAKTREDDLPLYRVSVETKTDNFVLYSQDYEYRNLNNAIRYVMIDVLKLQLKKYFIEKQLPITKVNIYPSEKFILEYNSSTLSVFVDNSDVELIKKLTKLADLDIFDNREIREYDFDVYTMNYQGRHKILMENLRENAVLITGDGKVFFYEERINGYIFWTPPHGTIFKHIETAQCIEISGGNIYSVQLKTQTKERETVKYMFYRHHIPYNNSESSITDKFIIELCEKNNVDRIVFQNSKVRWVDSDTGKLVECYIGTGKIFDTITNMEVEFKNGKVAPRDPKVKIGIKYSYYLYDFDDYQFDYIKADDLPDGEYKDCITNEKFQVKDGKIVDQKPVISEYSIFPNFEAATDNIQMNFLRKLPSNKIAILCLSSKNIYKLSEDNTIVKKKAEVNCRYNDNDIVYYLADEGVKIV